MKQRMYRLIAFVLAFVLLFQCMTQEIQPEGRIYAGEANPEITADGVPYPEEPEAAPPVIVSEVEEKREETVKHFRRSDGSFIAVQYEGPVHYQDENGKWQEYDNRLQESSQSGQTQTQGSGAEGAELRNRKSNKEIRLSKTARPRNMVNLTVQGHSVSWGYPGAARQVSECIEEETRFEGDEAFLNLKHITQQVMYREVYPQVDLQYFVSPGGIKENIILKNRKAQSTFEVQYDMQGLSVYQENAQTILLQDARGETVYVIKAPYMTDANGAMSTGVTLSILEQKGSLVKLRVEADTQWLSAEERAYPILVDPTVWIKQEYRNIDSVYIASETPNTCYGIVNGSVVEGTVYVGTANGRGKQRTLIQKKDLPVLGDGDIVTGARLRLVKKKNDATMRVEAHRVTSAWTVSNATWNKNIQYQSTVLDYFQVTAGEEYYDKYLNITAAVRDWYRDPGSNHGIILIAPEVEADTTRKLQTSFFSGLSVQIEDQYRPLFSVEYRNNKGLESYWTYTDLGAGDAGTAYINDYTGNLVFIHNDAATGGQLMPASLTHVYNGYMALQKYERTYPYVGRGWKLNIQQTVLPARYYVVGIDESKYPFVYTDGDGTEHYFYKKPNGEIWDEDGLGLKLTENKASSTERYKITEDQGGSMAFHSDGRLNYIADANGNRMTVNYESGNPTKILGVTDGAGKQLKIVENDVGSKYMTRIEDAAGRKYVYNFDSGKLWRITYPDGRQVQYDYDAEGSLIAAKDSAGYQLKFYYTAAGAGKQVNKVEEYGESGALGQVITFDRSKKNTTVIRTSGRDSIYGNSDDILTTYQFDNYGRTISAESHTATQDFGAEAYTYTAADPDKDGKNIRTLNRVRTAHGLGANVVNLLNNSSAEVNGGWSPSAWLGDCSFTAEMTTAQRYHGQRSLGLTVNSFAGRGSARYAQDVPNTIFQPGKTYTISGYVKTSGVSNAAGNYGACIIADSSNADGSWTKFYSEHITGTTDTAINNGWRRFSVTFTVPSNSNFVRVNLTLREATGTAWFDAIQAEEGKGASVYNLVQNSSMEKSTNGIPDGWTGENLTISQQADHYSNEAVKDRRYSFRIKGEPGKYKTLYQDIPVSGKEEDIYILSGWAKANAVPVDQAAQDRPFTLSVKVFYSDGTSKWKTPAWFNDSVTDWQFASTTFTLEDGTTAVKTPVKIRIYLRYENQANFAYFDQIQLIRDIAQSYVYNNEGKLVSTASNAEQKSNMEYSNADLTKLVDAKGFDYKYTYDSKHNMTKATSQRGTTYHYTYDSKGMATALMARNPAATMEIKSTVTYTGGYVSKTSDQDGYETSYVYDTNRGTLTRVKDPTGTTSYTYHADNDRMESVQKTLANGEVIQNTYGYTGNRMTAITHNGMRYQFTFDQFGKGLKTFAGNRELISHTYDNRNGLLKRSDFGNGNYVTYSYDQMGNVEAIAYNGVEKYRWEKNSAGNTTRYIDQVNQVQYDYEYDTTGRLVRTNTTDLTKAAETDRTLYRSEYGYDLNNNVNRLVHKTPQGMSKQLYTYGKDNLAESYTMSSNRQVTYTHDGLGRLTSRSTGTVTPVETKYTYLLSKRNAAGQDLYRTNKLRAEEMGTDAIYWYDYDVAGNIITIKEKIDGVFTDRVSYTYDELNQLTRENNWYSQKSITYTYDKGGNITGVQEYAYTLGTLGAVENTLQYSYGDSSWTDLMTSYNGQNITYDGIGNPLQYRDGMQMTWQDGRRLASLQTNGHMLTYSYDAEGLRSSKTVDGKKHTYYYEGSKLVYEDRGNISLRYEYDSYGNLSMIGYRLENGTVANYYVLCNSRGDVEFLYNGSGDLRVRYLYDAWGNIISITDGNGNAITDPMNIGSVNPIRYRGYYYDGETGLYYLKSRYYDPQVKRFVNADAFISTGQGILGNNMFAYCGNNSVNRADPSGMFWQTIIDAVEAVAKIVAEVVAKAAASAAAGAAANTVTAAIKGGGVFRQVPNGLASALTAQSNTLSAVSKGAGTLGKVAGAAGMGLTAINVSMKVYGNFNNDNLTLSRKISDSVVDVGVTVGITAGAGAIGAAIGTAIPIPGVGTAAGFVIGTGVGWLADNTPVVGWVKDGVGAVVDGIGNAAKAVGNFFGGLFA